MSLPSSIRRKGSERHVWPIPGLHAMGWMWIPVNDWPNITSGRGIFYLLFCIKGEKVGTRTLTNTHAHNLWKSDTKYIYIHIYMYAHSSNRAKAYSNKNEQKNKLGGNDPSVPRLRPPACIRHRDVPPLPPPTADGASPPSRCPRVIFARSFPSHHCHGQHRRRLRHDRAQLPSTPSTPRSRTASSDHSTPGRP